MTLHVPDAARRAALAQMDAELEEFFILSDLKITGGRRGSGTEEPVTATLRPTEHRKCERCWRFRVEVGTVPEQPTLCARCADAVAAR